MSWSDGAVRTLEPASHTAVWYHHGKPPVPIRWALVRDPDGEPDTQALLCTGASVAPVQILEWFALRWQPEVTPYQVRGRLYREARARLGVETRRQWSDRAITRATPILTGLFSRITRAAHSLQQESPITQRTAAWYAKPAPTFVDAIAPVRRHLWLASDSFSMSLSDYDRGKPVPEWYARLIDSLAYAA